MMAEAVVGQWQWQLLLGTSLFVAFSMSHSCHLSPFCFGCLFCLHFRKMPTETGSDCHKANFLMSWAQIIWARPSVHLLMSNLQARMLTYMGTLMYMRTGIYNVFVSHISSIYIYIYINIFKIDIYNIYIIYLIQKIPMYTHPSQPYTVELIPWIIEVGLFSLGTAGGILRPSSVICTETCYHGALRSITMG